MKNKPLILIVIITLAIISGLIITGIIFLKDVLIPNKSLPARYSDKYVSFIIPPGYQVQVDAYGDPPHILLCPINKQNDCRKIVVPGHMLSEVDGTIAFMYTGKKDTFPFFPGTLLEDPIGAKDEILVCGTKEKGLYMSSPLSNSDPNVFKEIKDSIVCEF